MGSVTSGNFSPMLGHGIALALVDSAPIGRTAPRRAAGHRAARPGPAGRVVETPFVPAGQWATSR